MIAALVVAGTITGMHVLMTYVEQMSDSNNITGQTWLTTFLFPAMPYHNLWRAARRTAGEDSAMPRWHPEPRRT